MLIQALGHADRSEDSDAAGATAFERDPGLQREIGSFHRGPAMPCAMRREVSPLRQVCRNSDGVGIGHANSIPSIRPTLFVASVPDTVSRAITLRCPHWRGGGNNGFHSGAREYHELSEKIDALSTDARAAQVYSEDHLKIDGGDARMYVTAASAASDASAFLSENYERLVKIVQAAAVELDKAATMYEETDREKAERLDSTYQAGE
ncbi:hypothetical protein ABT332_05805 [Saccharomonospora azurea]|uniref:hypothetical protein n=1 Tax=Saccharomonospora azurea TaxID=40988 RepID=UPI00332F3A03